MPPKEGKKKPPAVIIDGIDTSPFTREKLEQFTFKLKDELDREREERNYFQLERDKIRIFWELTKEQLDEAKAVIKNIERASEVIEEEHALVVQFEKQKTKFLKYEQISDLATLREENEAALQAAKEEHEEQEIILFNDKRSTKQKLAAKLHAESEDLKRTKIAHVEQLAKTKAQFNEQENEIENRAANKLAETKVELEVRHRTELAEVVERKNKQVSQLIEQHEKAFAELKNYYNDITLNNLSLIASIKRQLDDMEAAKMRADKICREAMAEAKKLREPLELATADNKELKRQMANYDRDKASLRAKIKVLAKLEKQYEILKWGYEGLEVQFDRLLPQRDALKARFTRSVMEVKDKLSEDAVKLEAKLNAVQKRDLVPMDLQELLRLKDAQVEDLRYETARLHKAHDDLLATYEVKLANLGVPPDELGFQPLKPITVAGKSPIIGLGPANLVTKNK